MKGRGFILIAATVLGLVAVGHLYRVVFAWPLQIGSLSVPLWASGVAVVLAAGLSAWGFRLTKR